MCLLFKTSKHLQNSTPFTACLSSVLHKVSSRIHISVFGWGNKTSSLHQNPKTPANIMKLELENI